MRVSEENARKSAKAILKLSNSLDKKRTVYNTKLTAVQEKYASDFSDIEAEIATHKEVLENYATNERDQLFGDQKTVEFFGLKLSFRLGAGKISFLDGFNAKTALAKVQKVLPDYIQTKETIDKVALKKDAEKLKGKMKRCGLAVVQEETFEVKL